jgi:hypothetical protein
MDATFFLAICGSLCTFLYVSSLCISIRFRGDFGLLTDDSPADSESRPEWLSSKFTSSLQQRKNTLSASKSYQSLPTTDTGSKQNIGATWNIQDGSSGGLLDIPRGDLTLLLAPPVAGYGTKLHNLKIGLKDT